VVRKFHLYDTPGMLVLRQQSWCYERTHPMADKKPKDKKQSNEPFKNFEDVAKNS
jgi:hypothetical protein